MKPTLLLVVGALVLLGCSNDAPSNRAVSVDYFDNSGRTDVLSGGVRMIPVETPKGTFRVWTKRIGNNPTMKVLLLHGGPGFNHEYLEAFDSYFPAASIEYYYYDQLGSYYSDQPEEPELWDLPRFVEEVEQVRQALGLRVGGARGVPSALRKVGVACRTSASCRNRKFKSLTIEQNNVRYAPVSGHCATIDLNFRCAETGRLES